MKQIIKDYLYLELGIIILAIVIGCGLLPIIFIDNVLFAILYLVVLYPLVALGIYKIVFTLYTKNSKL